MLRAGGGSFGMNSVKSFNEINKDISIALEYELYCHRELLRLEALEIGH